jgi:tRNA-(ms[2]io[6]A)-hydroxylase
MLRLRYETPVQWTRIILSDLDSFLQDHAANERKACGSALRLASHYPDLVELVDAMIDFAREELDHFRSVYDVLRARGMNLGQDSPDPYMSQLHAVMHKSVAGDYLLDRLIVSAVVEARGCERFALLAQALEEKELRTLYEDLTRAEARHHSLFLRLAGVYYDSDRVGRRLDTILDAEAKIVSALPLRAVLH